EKRKRSTYDNLYDNEEVKNAVMKQANDIQANLDPQFPSFIKFMLRSHVTGGFWLGLSRKFCTDNLPKQDTMIVLEDESGSEYDTKYLVEKIGLSAGWRGFSIAHKLVEGDALVFHLVTPSKFKVYIVRSRGSDEVDCALGLLKLETCNQQVESEQSEDESKDLGSEVLNGLKFCESVVDFKEVKSFQDFSIVVNDLVIDSALSKYLRTKYYELCCSQNSFLHNSVLDGLNCKLISGMISETINITDAIRASKLTTPHDNFDTWDKTLKAFKMMGMNVGFLLIRLDQLMNLASTSKRLQEARLERANAKEEKSALELKLSEVRERIDRLDSEIEALGANPNNLDVMFQEMAKAPW
ncbi:hypothetical protein CICLE_v10030084mg, partial [Citrus x clementina]